MDKLSKILENFEQESNSRHNNQLVLKDGEFRGEDGLIYCSTCKKACSVKIYDHEFRRPCDCQLKKLEDDANRKREFEKTRRIEKIKKLSLIGKRYQNANFENT